MPMTTCAKKTRGNGRLSWIHPGVLACLSFRRGSLTFQFRRPTVSSNDTVDTKPLIVSYAPSLLIPVTLIGRNWHSNRDTGESLILGLDYPVESVMLRRSMMTFSTLSL